MGRNYGGGWMVGHDMISAVTPGEQADYLERMIDTLEQGGWTQQDHENEEGMCIEGASRKILTDSGALLMADWEKDSDDNFVVPGLCATGFAAEATLRKVLGAELGMPPKDVQVAATSGHPNEVPSITVQGYDHVYNPIPAFNDADGRTKEDIIKKLREVVEEIRAGVGVFDGDAPAEAVAAADPVVV